MKNIQLLIYMDLMNMKQSKITYQQLNEYIINSILSSQNISIIEQINALQSDYRLSTIQFYFSIISYFILRYDYNKTADKSRANMYSHEDSHGILPKKENELDLF